jgi:hypothetical protein
MKDSISDPAEHDFLVPRSSEGNKFIAWTLANKTTQRGSEP